ncbi:hypothetical protein AKJ60_00585 [candidate division MSBL1 archaeon SCGC-AAA385M11]|nr:hypothetical protein AKJ60_00585 [candidate division MSBL1 archaeon SCGC-AAA385M11]
MANKEYTESGMSFVFDDQNVFLPEKDPCLKKLQHVKACDFVSVYRKKSRKTLLFIEAKSSAPYQTDSLKKYLYEIYSQFWHSLFFYISLVFDRHANKSADLPDVFKQKQNLKGPIMCILVVRNHKKEWLQPLQEALRKEMMGIKNVFVLQDIIVTNEQGARKYGFV